MQNILVTGADGYLGSSVCERLLRDTDAHLWMWVRADSEAEFTAKRHHVQQRFQADFDSRLTLVSGNLLNDNPFHDVDSALIDCIIHIAAVTAFNIDATSANTINRDGTRKLLTFARSCPNLARLSYVSTAYAAGLMNGTIPEKPLPSAGPFANHYERSKCEAETLLINEFDDLPWHVYRVATVIADNDHGDVIQYNVFHNTMCLIFYGLISMLPGDESVPVYFVTGQFVADSIAELAMTTHNDRQFFHICHEQKDALTLGQLIDICFEVFNNDEAFRKRRILRPLFTDFESFELLAEGLKGLSGQVVSQAVDSIRPFAPQMFVTKSFCNDHTQHNRQHYTAPDPQALARNTVHYLVSTKWGKENTGALAEGNHRATTTTLT